MHQHGIRPALPEYDAQLQTANDAAAAADLWDAWPEEEPGSHRYEYIAAAYDNYLDLWTVQPTRYEGHRLDEDDVPAGTSHFGTFRAGSRALMKERIPEAYRLCAAFFQDHLTYVAELPEDFEGTFHMNHVPELRYTTKSQHLRQVSLRGTRAANVVGNDDDNVLRGNAGDNALDGGDGTDVAVFSGPRDGYELSRQDGVLIVRDLTASRDGTDTLVDIEVLRFADGDHDPR